MELRPDKFKLIAGDLSLDLVNTASSWQRTDKNYVPAADSISDLSDLVSWALKANAVDEKAARELVKRAASIGGGGASLRRARKVRAAIYGLSFAMAKGEPPLAGDVEHLEKERLKAVEGQKLEYAGGRFELRRRRTERPLDSILDAVVFAAVDLFTSDRAKRIRICGGESCGWLFVDDSRGRNRHWCDMRDCGNLAKVRRFRKNAAKAAGRERKN
ncbi:MAG TPA: CGNR zinc finger domain-containing protein [Pyrinomonadaceae bacterium]|nr:CGNR zinc finger domain-containing protein [Pyrinomonadaceae bacterium]